MKKINFIKMHGLGNDFVIIDLRNDNIKIDNDLINKKWVDLYKIKQEVNIAIEEKRSNKEIGSSLEADLLIYVNEKEFKLLDGLDLEEYFITSKVKKIQNKTDNKIIIEVKKSKGSKCTLCWKILEKKCERKFCGIN